MNVFITMEDNGVVKRTSIDGIDNIKDVISLHSAITKLDSTDFEPSRVEGRDLGLIKKCQDVVEEYSGHLLKNKALSLDDFDLLTYHGYSLKELKELYKSSLGDATYCLRINPYSVKITDLTMSEIKLLYKEFGEIIKFWEE